MTTSAVDKGRNRTSCVFQGSTRLGGRATDPLSVREIGLTYLNEKTTMLREEMDSLVCVIICSEPDIILAREQGRRIRKEIGFTAADLTRIATGISEIGRNIVSFAEKGEITIQAIKRNSRLGIEIIAQDRGPGIKDVQLALSDGYSTGKGRGLGLPGARRLMDEFEVVSLDGNGTTVTMRKWAAKGD